MDWQPIESAPRDGRVFLAYFGNDPQFVAWCGPVAKSKHHEAEDAGFRVMMPPARGYGFGIHGNFAPFTPSFWMPLPPPPDAGERR